MHVSVNGTPALMNCLSGGVRGGGGDNDHTFPVNVAPKRKVSPLFPCLEPENQNYTAGHVGVLARVGGGVLERGA